jgi:hypothetical protein
MFPPPPERARAGELDAWRPKVYPPALLVITVHAALPTAVLTEVDNAVIVISPGLEIDIPLVTLWLTVTSSVIATEMFGSSRPNSPDTTRKLARSISTFDFKFIYEGLIFVSAVLYSGYIIPYFCGGIKISDLFNPLFISTLYKSDKGYQSAHPKYPSYKIEKIRYGLPLRIVEHAKLTDKQTDERNPYGARKKPNNCLQAPLQAPQAIQA